MRVMCARRMPASVSSVGARGPDQPIRSKYPSALNKFDFRTGWIFDEGVMHHARRELQIGPALQDLDSLQRLERLVEIDWAPAYMIQRVAGARRRRRRGLLDEHEHISVLQRVLALVLRALAAEALLVPRKRCGGIGRAQMHVMKAADLWVVENFDPHAPGIGHESGRLVGDGERDVVDGGAGARLRRLGLHPDEAG